MRATHKPLVPGQRTSSAFPAPSGRPFWPLLVGTCLLVLGAVEGAIIHANPSRPPWQGADDAWLRTMARGRTSWLTDFGKFVDFVGGPLGSSLIVLVLAIAFVAVTRRRAAVFLVVVSLTTTVVSQVAKRIVDRPRPPGSLVTVHTPSFPSGHTIFAVSTSVALIAVATAAATRLLGVLLGIAATLLVVWDRTYLGVHWISDTLGGLLLGAGTALLLCWLMSPYLSPQNPQSLT